MYKKFTDEELSKLQRQNWINMFKAEARIIAYFAVVLFVYLTAANKMWWLLCGSAAFLAVCVFVYSLCQAAGRENELIEFAQRAQHGDDEG